MTQKPKQKAKKPEDESQIDLAAILKEPLPVLKNGKRGKMDPLEASIRGLIKKALREKKPSAIKALLALAIEHDLVARPPPPRTGGIVLIPSSLPEFDAIFEEHWTDMGRIFAALERHYGKT